MRFKGSRRERRHDNEPLNDCRSEERFYYLAVGEITRYRQSGREEHFITNFRLAENASQAIKTGLNFATKNVTSLNGHRVRESMLSPLDLIFICSSWKKLKPKETEFFFNLRYSNDYPSNRIWFNWLRLRTCRVKYTFNTFIKSSMIYTKTWSSMTISRRLLYTIIANNREINRYYYGSFPSIINYYYSSY